MAGWQGGGIMNDAKADRIDLITRIIMEASIIVAIALLCHVTGQRGYQRGFTAGVTYACQEVYGGMSTQVETVVDN